MNVISSLTKDKNTAENSQHGFTKLISCLTNLNCFLQCENCVCGQGEKHDVLPQSSLSQSDEL